MHRRRLIVIGNQPSRRTDLLLAAADRVGDLDVHVVTWLDLINGDADLRDIVGQDDVVRIDSPGKHFETERALLGLWHKSHEWHGSAHDFSTLTEDRGRIRWPGIWFAGFCSTLDRIRQQLAECPPHRCIGDVQEIRTMFDKPATHARLAAAGVSVPPAMGRISGFYELLNQMREHRWLQVFLKLAYGSSASGTVAFRIGPRGRMCAFTTVELDGVDPDGSPRLYNTRRIRRLEDIGDIADVVNALCPHGVHVERWLPKAGIDGQTFDLRVLMLRGEPCHIVTRMSRSPMTNLHLLNQRGDTQRVRERCGEAHWQRAMEQCIAAANAFPRSFHAGVDLMFSPDFRRSFVLEVNAFGDLLPDVLWQGMDPYEAQLRMIFTASMAEVA